jgi:hypothetical protein
MHVHEGLDSVQAIVESISECLHDCFHIKVAFPIQLELEKQQLCQNATR